MRPKISLIHNSAAGVFLTGLVLLFCFCIHDRNNPLDAHGTNYGQVNKPSAAFILDTVSSFLYDTVAIKILCANPAVSGSGTEVKKIYFSWKGDGIFDDSTAKGAGDTITVYRVFPAETVTVRMKAVDANGHFGTVNTMALLVSRSFPSIISLKAPDSAASGATFIVSVAARDTGGTITTYLWAQNGTDFNDSVHDSSFVVYSNKTGTAAIPVKVRDNKGIESPSSMVHVKIYEKPDTSGPEIRFLAPLNNDTVGMQTTAVYLFVNDSSGISGVSLNGAPMLLSGNTWLAVVSLVNGVNKLVATASDSRGNVRKDSIVVFHFYYSSDQTPPAIVLKMPPHNQDTVNTPTFIVRILAVDESGVAGVTINGILIDMDPVDSSYYYPVTLQAGMNLFATRSTDTKGNVGFDTIKVTYLAAAIDVQPPQILIAEPKNLVHIADSVVTVRGTALDPSGISALQVNGTDAKRNYPNWSSVVNLVYGYDTIRVVATDSSTDRNVASDSVIVVQNYPPQFTDLADALDTFVLVSQEVDMVAHFVHKESDSIFCSLLSRPNHATTPPFLTTAGSSVMVAYVPTTAGTDTFRLVVRDRWNDADTLIWHVFINAPGDSAPFFTTDPRTIPDTAVTLTNYTTVVHAKDPNGRPLSYSLLAPPSPASMAVDSSGKVSWQPAETDTGLKHIAVVATNGKAQDTLEWNLAVLAFNWPPVLANPGNKTIDELKSLQFLLSATDRNNDALEFSFGPTFPAGARLDSNRFSWTPGYRDSGQHPVVFIVRERNRTPSLSDTEAITIRVKDVNQPPALAYPGNKSCVAGNTLTFTLVATDPDSNAISYSMANVPTGAMLAGPDFSWTPTKAQAGLYRVTFFARDSGSPPLADSQSIAITVTADNAPPILNNPGNKTIDENQPLVIDLIASDPNNDPLSFSMSSAPAGSTLIEGRFSWTPTYSQAGTYTVRFYVSDNVAPPLRDTAAVTITVKNVNQPPSLINPGNKTALEGSQLLITLAASDPDGNIISYGMESAPAGAIMAANQFRWTPTYQQAGVYTVIFIARDNGVPPRSDSEPVVITVNNVNRPPVITYPGNKTGSENQLLQFTLPVSDSDNDAISFSMQGAPAGAVIEDGTFSWKPTYSQAGFYDNVRIIATDNGTPPLSDKVTIVITIRDVNQPPVLVNPGNRTAIAGQLLRFTLSASDPDTNAITFSMTGAPPGATLSSGQFSWTPSVSQTGTFPVIFTARDNGTPQLSDTESILITVHAANSAPVLQNPGNYTIHENQTLQFTLSATDGNGSTISYSMVDAPAGSTLTNGVFSWTPAFSQAGVYTVGFIATNSGVPPLSDTEKCIITVNPLNGPPEISAPASKVAFVTENIILALAVSDPDSDSVVVSMVNAPNNARLNGNVFRWTPNFSQIGSYTVRFYATDNGVPPLRDSCAVVFIVRNQNTPPLLVDPGLKTIAAGQPLEFTLLASDREGNMLTYSMSDAPAGASLAGPVFSWTPTSAQIGLYTVTFTVTDCGDPPLSDSKPVKITVLTPR